MPRDDAYNENKSKLMISKWQDPVYRDKNLASIRKSSQERWQDPAYRAQRIETMKKVWETEEYRESRKMGKLGRHYIP